MREIIEKLRADLATNKVDPLEVAKIIADLLPRSVSFNSINDSGYVSGNVLQWWIADETVVFRAGLAKAKARYKLDKIHTVLPTTAKIGIRKYGGATMGYLRFDVGSDTVVVEFPQDVVIQQGESIECFVETLPGIAAISVTIPHYLYKEEV